MADWLFFTVALSVYFPKAQGRVRGEQQKLIAVSQVFSWDLDMGRFFYVRLVWKIPIPDLRARPPTLDR